MISFYYLLIAVFRIAVFFLVKASVFQSLYSGDISKLEDVADYSELEVVLEKVNDLTAEQRKILNVTKKDLIYNFDHLIGPHGLNSVNCRHLQYVILNFLLVSRSS